MNLLVAAAKGLVQVVVKQIEIKISFPVEGVVAILKPDH